MTSTPMRFCPLLKQTIWGGRRLGEMLHKPIGDADDYAESWEIVDHGEDQSVVTEGELTGQSLGELFTNRRQWLMGKDWVAANPDAQTFPLLLKFLDCNRVLSVQVHPDDAYGATMQPPDLGKTEAWVILHSEPDSVIYSGLKAGVDRESLREMMLAGETDRALHSYHPEVGDCVFIPAGTVHALGGGLVVAEIQQSSNTTFRLFDWNRVDASGKSRPLHIESSLEVSDYERGPVDPIRKPIHSGTEMLVECDKFVLRRVHDTDQTIGGDDRCHLLTVISGEATLSSQDGPMKLATGESVLLPAACGAIQLQSGDATVLWMSPPTSI
ncbi:type I phosphomannose isomerase catalytic subunit [Rhodopirellula bahusiensis]|uniref:type I phosphomannose isomerase catalytic subunit n=1 Tax=Rhodopirellula bahusiensis TaxID=2014065 RepID=UPI0032664876